MTGAESLIHTLIASGVEVCFANPGTTEIHFVAALDKVEGMRCVPGMAETVVTGCADGYARMAGKPAATLPGSWGLLGGSASEYGRLCRGEEGHEGAPAPPEGASVGYPLDRG